MGYNESKSTMQRNARELGFRDLPSLITMAGRLTGGVLFSAAAGSISYGVAVSATLPEFLAGTGALSCCATANFATGGLVLLIGAGVWGLFTMVKSARQAGDMSSKEMRNQLV